jgi:[Skp1-protein]-hydroxyproline N-acetylglucosaminyltransferase
MIKLLLFLFIVIIFAVLFFCLKDNNYDDTRNYKRNYKKNSITPYEKYISSSNPNMDDLNYILNVVKKPKDERTIFISVASYRDKECPNTIREIFTKAYKPDRIRIGICQQNKDEDVDCMVTPYDDKIRIVRLKHTEAKGPTYARYICSTLYQGEDYYMQIDSHSRFEKDWDKKLIDMIPLQKAVLSCYPNDWMKEGKDTSVSIYCQIKKSDRGTLKTTAYLKNPTEELMEIPYIGGGFFFTYGVFLNTVPYDENLPHLFEGEEILFTMRMWTHGWDFYAPNKIILYHYYYRDGEPKFWDENPDYQKYNRLSFKKVNYMIKMSDKKPKLDMSKGMGDERSVEDYYRYIGFDPETDEISSRDFCKI